MSLCLWAVCCRLLRIATKNTTQQQSPRRTERAGAGGLGLGGWGWGLQDAAGVLAGVSPVLRLRPGGCGRGPWGRSQRKEGRSKGKEEKGEEGKEEQEGRKEFDEF